MIKSVENYPVSTLLNGDSNIVYHVPKYQREYSWGTSHWEHLFDDLLDNDAGYFLGSIICINQSNNAHEIQVLELVDGQQRMTTFSLLLAAIYARLNLQKGDLDEDQRADLNNLKHRLVVKKSSSTRLEPQTQNNNLQDYKYVLSSIGLLEDIDPPANAGNRRVLKSFRYFQSRINMYLESISNSVSGLLDLLELVNSSVIVKIEVDSHADAYVLFESLNNRGAALTAIDLIKNKLLAEVGKKDASKIDSSFNNWSRILEKLSDDYAIQERFFRHYYNAFLNDFKEITKIPFATRSKLIQIYERLINNSPFDFLHQVTKASAVYSQLIGVSTLKGSPELRSALEELDHVQGVPSYTLLLYLWLKRDELILDDTQLAIITKVLIKFFVRRNLTDTPPTRDLDRIFVDKIIPKIIKSKVSERKVTDLIRKELMLVSAPIEIMKNALGGDLYIENAGVTRFILCAIEESTMTRETQRDLWKLNKHGKYIWTIEHIFPQGENIPKHWVEMISGGNLQIANEYRDKYVHKLGNLTISGFNSTLGTKSFKDKRDRVDENQRSVGYRNGLSLNEELANKESWSRNDIEKRTDELSKKVLELFSYEGEIE